MEEVSRHIISVLMKLSGWFFLLKNITINFNAWPWCSYRISVHLPHLHNETWATPSASLTTTYFKSFSTRQGYFAKWFLLFFVTEVHDYITMTKKTFQEIRQFLNYYHVQSLCQKLAGGLKCSREVLFNQLWLRDMIVGHDCLYHSSSILRKGQPSQQWLSEL